MTETIMVNLHNQLSHTLHLAAKSFCLTVAVAAGTAASGQAVSSWPLQLLLVCCSILSYCCSGCWYYCWWSSSIIMAIKAAPIAATTTTNSCQCRKVFKQLSLRVTHLHSGEQLHCLLPTIIEQQHSINYA